MTVQVRLPTVLRPLADGENVVVVEGDTIKDVVAELDARYPGLGDRLIDRDGSLHRFVNLFLDDEDIRYLKGLETPVSDGDEISIFPAVAGG